MSPPHRPSLPHLRALDGLRGLAVLGVLFFHADGALPGGYLGVDLFFVLSGYLITSLLLAEHAGTGSIHLATFWVRRARRLFPAVLALMPAVALYGKLLAKADELASLRADALATLGYVQNWHAIWSDKSYWELFADPSPLEHTWSLCIEEQFYVLWPLLVSGLLAVTRRPRRAVLVTSLLFTALSMAAMLLFFDEESTTRVYFGTDTRASAILSGAALAAALPPGSLLPDRAVRLVDGLGVVSALGLGLAWAKLDGQSPFLYRGGLWLTQLAGASLIVCGVCGQRSLVGHVLSVRPLALIGTISYGVYLWHWPVNCALTGQRLHLGPLWLNSLRFAVTFTIAILSYRFYERPIRTRGVFFGKAVVVVPLAVLLSVGLVLLGTRKRPLPPPPPKPALRPEAAEKRWPGIFSVDARALPPAAELPQGTLRLLTLGDSVASKLGMALRYRQEEFHAFVAERGVGDCSILESLAATQVGDKKRPPGNSCSARWETDAEELRPDVTLIVLGGGYFQKVRVNGTLHDACMRGFKDAYRAKLDLLLAGVQKHSTAVVVALVPYPIGRWRSKGIVERVDCFDAILEGAARARKLPTLDLKGHVCPTVDCNVTSGGEPIRPDGLHFDGVGAEETARFTLSELRRLGFAGPSPAPSTRAH